MAEKTPLQIFYDRETNQLENDVAYLDTQLDKYDDHIGSLTPLANPSDEAYAQTVVDANRHLSQAINFGVIATGCGCSVATASTGDFLAGTAATVYYEIAQNVMDNNSYDGYDGDDPLGEASPTNLTNGSGGSTTLNPSNYGRGIDNQISSGDSALLLYVSLLNLLLEYALKLVHNYIRHSKVQLAHIIVQRHLDQDLIMQQHPRLLKKRQQSTGSSHGLSVEEEETL